ncbi:sodium:calcium antiporter [Alcanivorax profundi]|uniref:Sodium:calcium antiporter n=1 Tax=Alcanivorax profundi TaxID=2338368 RepID=A0A418XZE0_9GAMM|nr:calcium/sodium antiporter [Alcanivorax profundi]RJG18392.1 sodium:calcium antiporter [Alcanivorax profundi]
MTGVLLFILGLLLLTLGGEMLIRGALALAHRVGVSPLLSGLVIVGFGTSAPELVVSVNAAIEGKPDIAIGNVVGSNIGNVLLILGVCALITPLTVTPLALRRDAMCVVAASLLCVALGAGGSLDHWDAALLLLGLTGYLSLAYWTERSGGLPSAQVHEAETAAVPRVTGNLAITVGVLVAGLCVLIAGSQVFVVAASSIAVSMGIPEAVVGLILVAVGTSLPELTISVMSALRKQADVAVGNILGSNIFNLLGILGISAFMQPLPMPVRVIEIDQWIMLGTSLLLLLFLYTSRRLTRIEGAVLLCGYGFYVWASFSGWLG